MSNRIERVGDLIRAEHTILALIKTKGAVRAIEAKRLADQIVVIRSRRESAWDALINVGFIIPEGKGYYNITDDGQAQLERWNGIYGQPDHLVNLALNNSSTIDK